jgi:hypothetical protein
MPEGARAADTPQSLGQAGFILADAFKTFFEKRGVWTMVAFALLYRVSIGLLEKIGPFFMVDPVEKGGLGMSNELLGIVYGTYGLLAVLAGSLIGGWYVAKRGLKPVLFTLCCVLNIPIATQPVGNRRRRGRREVFLRFWLGGLHDLPDAATGARQIHHDPLRLRHWLDGDVRHVDRHGQRPPAGSTGLRQLLLAGDGGDRAIFHRDVVRALPS